MKFKIQNRKGSHVGVILSMIVFMGFLVFLFLLLQPSIDLGKDKQPILERVTLRLENEFIGNLTVATISLDIDYVDSGTDSCFSISHPITLGSLDYIVKDELNSIVDSAPTLNIKWQDTSKKFFKVYYSEEQFNDYILSGLSCSSPSNEDYEITSIKDSKIIFETKILDFILKVNEDYNQVKKDLKVPIGDEFLFRFKYGNGTEIGMTEKDIPLDIYVGEETIQYIDKDANINSGTLIVRIW